MLRYRVQLFLVSFKRCLKTSILTYLHCFYHTFVLLKLKNPHQICTEHEPGLKFDRSFCSCGYLNDGIPYDKYLLDRWNLLTSDWDDEDERSKDNIGI